MKGEELEKHNIQLVNDHVKECRESSESPLNGSLSDDQPACKTFCKLFAQAKVTEEFYDEMCSLKKCKYFEFYSSVSCLFAEGVEFMTKNQIYDAIKRDWGKVISR